MFWGWKPSKNRNIEPHQNDTGSYKKKSAFGEIFLPVETSLWFRVYGGLDQLMDGEDF